MTEIRKVDWFLVGCIMGAVMVWITISLSPNWINPNDCPTCEDCVGFPLGIIITNDVVTLAPIVEGHVKDCSYWNGTETLFQTFNRDIYVCNAKKLKESKE